jgi:uncharacterized protein (TIGR03435 family)
MYRAEKNATVANSPGARPSSLQTPSGAKSVAVEESRQMLRTILVANLTMFSAASAFSQTGDAPAFEVASIRSTQGGRGRGEGVRRENIQVSPGTLTMRNVSFKSCVRWAYHVMSYQVSGPDWMDSERYDLSAKAAGPATEDQLRLMLQTLLAERFKLTLHGQTKELQAYVLMVGKNGSKLHESQTEGESSMEPDQKRMVVTVQRTPISDAVEMLSAVLRMPVVDMTGLKGRYDVTFDVAKYAAEMQTNGAPPDPVSMITNVLEREFGLKLELKKTPLDLLIVDRVEKAAGEN